MSTTWPLIKPLNSRPASVMYVILWGHRNSTTTESQLEWWMLLCYLASCLAAMLPFWIAWPIACRSLATSLPVFRLSLACLSPVFRYRNPNPCLSLSEPTPSPAKSVSANVCRILPAESGFCPDSAGRNCQSQFKASSEPLLSHNSAGRIRILPAELWLRSGSELALNWLWQFLPAESGQNPDSAGRIRQTLADTDLAGEGVGSDSERQGLGFR